MVERDEETKAELDREGPVPVSWLTSKVEVTEEVRVVEEEVSMAISCCCLSYSTSSFRVARTFCFRKIITSTLLE